MLKPKTTREKLFGKNSILSGTEINDSSTESLNRKLGDFERIYNQSAVGPIDHNEIIGPVHEGTVKHAIEIGAITKKFINKKNRYFIHLPEYLNYNMNVRILRELCRRREEAENINNYPEEKEPVGAMAKISEKLSEGRKIDKWSATQIAKILRSVGVGGTFDVKTI